MSLLLLFRPSSGGAETPPETDPFPYTLTIRDAGHQVTLRDRGHQATLRELRF